MGKMVLHIDDRSREEAKKLADLIDFKRSMFILDEHETRLKAMKGETKQVKMLWQHDPAQPIGVWDEIYEDARGLKVKGRILRDVAKGREAAALIAAGAVDGLSIGYRTKRASKNDKGQRVLTELELWEVSLVTFPMLPSARIAGKGDDPLAADWRELAETLTRLRCDMAGG